MRTWTGDAHHRQPRSLSAADAADAPPALPVATVAALEALIADGEFSHAVWSEAMAR